MARRVISVVDSGPASLRATDPAIEANAYAVAEDLDLTLILRARGVEFALEPGPGAPVDLSGSLLPIASGGHDLRALLESGVEVYVERDSIDALGLSTQDLVTGVRVADAAAVAGMLLAADAVLRW